MDHISVKQKFYLNVKKMIQSDFPDLDVFPLRYEDYSKSSCQIFNPKNVKNFWETVVLLRCPCSIIVSKLKTNKIEITDGILVYPFNTINEILNALNNFFPETNVPLPFRNDWNVTLVMCDAGGNVLLQTTTTADREETSEFPYFHNINKSQFKNVVMNCDDFPLDYQNTRFLRLQPNTNNFLAVCEDSGVGMIGHLMTKRQIILLPYLPFYSNTSKTPMSSSSHLLMETYLSIEGSFLSEIKL